MLRNLNDDTDRYFDIVHNGHLPVDIPIPGRDGNNLLGNDGTLQSNVRYRVRVTQMPAQGTLELEMDGVGAFRDAPDGQHTFTYEKLEDGVSQGTATVTINVANLISTYAYTGVGGTVSDGAATYAFQRAPVGYNFVGSGGAVSGGAATTVFDLQTEVYAYTGVGGAVSGGAATTLIGYATTIPTGDIAAIAQATFTLMRDSGFVEQMREVWRLQGLDVNAPLNVTRTTRVAGDITQSITGDGRTNTQVSRDG